MGGPITLVQKGGKKPAMASRQCYRLLKLHCLVKTFAPHRKKFHRHYKVYTLLVNVGPCVHLCANYCGKRTHPNITEYRNLVTFFFFFKSSLEYR